MDFAVNINPALQTAVQKNCHVVRMQYRLLLFNILKVMVLNKIDEDPPQREL